MVLKVMWVSNKNPKFAILAGEVSEQFGNRVIKSRKSGFLESSEEWTLAEEVEIPDNRLKFTTRKTSQGSELPVIELI
jgi:hypothetical protein